MNVFGSTHQARKGWCVYGKWESKVICRAKGPRALFFFFEIHIKNSFKGWFFCLLFNNGRKNINSVLSPSTTKTANLFLEKAKWHLRA